MEGALASIAPLVRQVSRLCEGHLRGDQGVAAAAMLAALRQSDPEAREPVAIPEHEKDLDGESLVIGMVLEIGELAEMLLAPADRQRALSWGRANLIVELERYLAAIRGAGEGTEP